MTTTKNIDNIVQRIKSRWPSFTPHEIPMNWIKETKRASVPTRRVSSDAWEALAKISKDGYTWEQFKTAAESWLQQPGSKG